MENKFFKDILSFDGKNQLLLLNLHQYHIQTTYLNLSQILKRLNHQNHIFVQNYLNHIHNYL